MRRLNVSRISIIYGDRLLEQAESWNDEKALVDYDKFKWYRKDGVLKYQNSVMVNPTFHVRMKNLRIS